MIERLEARNLLTLSFWHAELWTDYQGGPGVHITDNSVVVGEDFWVVIQAEDRRVDPSPIGGVQPGIAGASVDIDWSPNVELVDLVITDQLPIAREVTPDDDAVSIRAASFSSSGIGSPIGGDEPEEFARLKFDAIETGDADISLDIGADGVAMLPYVFTRAPFQHVFEGLPDTRVVLGCKAIPVRGEQ